MTVLILGYPDFFKEFLMEMDTSLEGLVAVLSKQVDNVKPWGIVYGSRLLWPSE